MRKFWFEIFGGYYFVHEESGVHHQSKTHTQWQVYKLCEYPNGEEYCQQFRDALIPSNASHDEIELFITNHYAS